MSKIEAISNTFGKTGSPQRDYSQNRHFFISNTFISNARLKLVKSQGKDQQHIEAELLLF